MHRFIFAVAWMTFACVAVADEPKAESHKAAVVKAMESFTGTWEIATVQPDGATKDARRLVFNKDGTYAALDKDGKELWAGTFEIDPTTKPRVWDHRSHAAKKEGKDILGIYDLDGDKLKVACVAGQWKGKEWVGKPRPTVIDSKQIDVMIEFKRVKSSPSEQPVGDKVPKPAASFVRTINGSDPAGFIALFAEDSVLDDAGRIKRGREAIREWAASDIFAAKVTLDVVGVNGDESDATITAQVDGTFDKTKLPDPFIMTFQIATLDGKITKLTCRLAEKK